VPSDLQPEFVVNFQENLTKEKKKQKP